MNVAVVCPNDYSTVLFCKGIVHEFKNNSHVHNTYVISDTYGENTNRYYTKIIQSWDVNHIHLRIDRFMSPVEDFRYLYRLYKILRHNKINVVVNISTKPNIYGTFAARLAGVNKVLCSVWGRGRVFVSRGDVKGLFLRVFVLGLYRLAFALSSKVWFTNIGDFNYFVDRRIVSKNKTIITKNYVNTDDYFPMTLTEEQSSRLRSELELKTDDKVVIMVGRMIWTKGVKEFIEASKLLKDKLAKVKFILVGPEEQGSPDSIPHAYLEENRKSENFMWVGFRRDVKDLYAISDVAVLPSYYKEGGYPRALTEPMAMGKPVIAADTVDCRSPVENGVNGYLVPVRDPSALANAIEMLMKDNVKREKFGAYSRVKAKAEYDEKVVVKQVIDAFLSKNGFNTHGGIISEGV
jgi:N,N'-diacetylbacillosaminyl-diphospho-undecaprenol alpha-1,3-N-acetylgalactosaminyltransferase